MRNEYDKGLKPLRIDISKGMFGTDLASVSSTCISYA